MTLVTEATRAHAKSCVSRSTLPRIIQTSPSLLMEEIRWTVPPFTMADCIIEFTSWNIQTNRPCDVSVEAEQHVCRDHLDASTRVPLPPRRWFSTRSLGGVSIGPWLCDLTESASLVHIACAAKYAASGVGSCRQWPSDRVSPTWHRLRRRVELSPTGTESLQDTP